MMKMQRIRRYGNVQLTIPRVRISWMRSREKYASIRPADAITPPAVISIRSVNLFNRKQTNSPEMQENKHKHSQYTIHTLA